MLISSIVLAASAFANTPLVPPAGKVLIGAWYDRNNTDTPKSINARFNYKPLAFFQTDIDLSGTFKPWTAPTITDQFLQQLQETGTNATGMLTIYPFQGLGSNITDQQLDDMSSRMNTIVNAGHPLFIRFASEMNGNWFQYGQQPNEYVATWQRVITRWRSSLGANKDKVAFIWSPNSGNGYPFFGGEFSINVNATDAATLANLKTMDTNGNGVLDPLDDPYYPYYPGDAYVDWVGMSIYHYGLVWPWIDNVIPDANKFELYLNNSNPALGNPTDGTTAFGYYPFYSYFSSAAGIKNNLTGAVVSDGNKPLIISETAATYHFAWKDAASAAKFGEPVPGFNDTVKPTRLQIKEAWWASFLNPTFLSKYPKMQAVCSFEFIKVDDSPTEYTWRDFSMFGGAPNPNTVDPPFVAEDNAVAGGFAADAQNMPFLQFAGPLNAVPATTGVSQATATAKSEAGSVVVGVLAFLASLLF
ncbi:hypothetical protein HDU98_010272 [Podochytrium sp. JEL0797]|nr:hypothetical protein HDU98_010272 [Podochytrium sp. JEL0797]